MNSGFKKNSYEITCAEVGWRATKTAKLSRKNWRTSPTSEECALENRQATGLKHKPLHQLELSQKNLENVWKCLSTVESLDNWDWEAFQIHRSWSKFQLPLSAPNVHLLIDSRILFPNCWVSIVRKNQQLRFPKTFMSFKY